MSEWGRMEFQFKHNSIPLNPKSFMKGERLEFSGAGEMEPEELEEEIKKRWEEYQSTLQHMNIYLQYRMNKVIHRG
ncbi:hypothetical protein QJS10_CPB19g01763 [Acorus calamus]|uniref:Uncharacterized protein n=1 Tax=Acorus calamus TaxID=4465 RepID=A0AAV9CH29_ACOCL|nr:hypothetical protein QJS10_CPB19g01763 [Acorus calamus]